MSTTPSDAAGQLVPDVIVSWLGISTTFPAPAAIGIVPVSFGAGRGVEGLLPAASAIRYVPCAGIVPVRFVRCQLVPPVAAYCTLHSRRSRSAAVRFVSSM